MKKGSEGFDYGKNNANGGGEDMSHSQMLGKFEYTLPAKF